MSEDTTNPLPTLNSINVDGQDYAIEDTVARKRAEAGTSIDIIRETFYPVGKLWISWSSTSPASIIGGSWTKLSNVFLRAGNDTVPGGSDDITLTAAQSGLPNHSHAVVLKDQAGTGAVSLNDPIACKTTRNLYGFTIQAGVNATSSHSNMPYYQNVHVWRRTA